MDRRITIQRATASRDEFNEPVNLWLTLATVWASYEPLSDGEAFRASETLAEASARFVVRYSTTLAGLDPKDRLTFDGGTWQIVRVKEIGRREGLEITTKARADG
jgi:SPP1 family predicted phage head-tail adaptor